MASEGVSRGVTDRGNGAEDGRQSASESALRTPLGLGAVSVPSAVRSTSLCYETVSFFGMRPVLSSPLYPHCQAQCAQHVSVKTCFRMAEPVKTKPLK